MARRLRPASSDACITEGLVRHMVSSRDTSAHADHRVVRTDRHGQDRGGGGTCQLLGTGRGSGGGLRGCAAGIHRLGDAHGRGLAAEQARLEHRLRAFLPIDATFSVGRYSQLGPCGDRCAAGAGRRRSWWAARPLSARRRCAELDLRPPPPEGVRERWRAALEREGAPALHGSWPRVHLGRREIEPKRQPAGAVRALKLLELGELEPRRVLAAVERRSFATRRCWRD